MIHTLSTNKFKIIIPVLILFLSVTFKEKLQYYLNHYLESETSNSERISTFTSETLARYNGVIEKNLYMAVLGIVYDVTKGKQHYAKGSPYHYFVGKDGSRALVTGDFKDESENKDHVLDLSCKECLSLKQWKKSLEKKYETVGILAGRYYERDGSSSSYNKEFEKKVESCLEEKELGRKQDQKYPPCNIAWSEDEGTKVWCTKSSGGIHRDWVGVPRQLYTPGDKTPKCVCINTDRKKDASMKLKEYKDCANTSVVCYVNTS